MALEVKVSDDRVTVSGSGLSLLRVKAAIAAFTSDGQVLSAGRTAFTAPLSAYLEAKPLFEREIIEDPSSIRQIENGAAIAGLHRIARERVREISENGEALTGLEHWDEILDPHQGIAANAMSVSGLSGMCLFDEQGTGKTVSLLAAYDILKKRGEIDTAIVLAPKTLQSNWKSEAQIFLGDAPLSIVLIEGDKEDRYLKLQTKADLFISTYETLDSELTHFISITKTRKVLLVADESFFVKNPDAQRSRAARDFRRHCVRAIVLCGSPAPNSPSDLIHQFDLADNGYTFRGTEPPDDPSKKKEFIETQIEARGVYLRRTKDRVLPNLPEKRFHVMLVDMEPKQALLYSEAKKDLALFLKTLDNRTFRRNLTTYFQKRAAMLQICVSPNLIDRMVKEVPAKYLALDKLLKDEIENKRNKIVVWSVYTKTIDDLVERYSSYNPVRVDGKVPQASVRQEMVDRFQNDPGTMLFIGNPAAAGAGVTLHSSHVVVYLSFSNQAAHYMQSLDRVHRRGQTSSNIDYHFLVCAGTIEQKELERLVSKQKTQSNLLGDAASENFTLEDALREIGAP